MSDGVTLRGARTFESRWMPCARESCTEYDAPANIISTDSGDFESPRLELPINTIYTRERERPTERALCYYGNMSDAGRP